MNAKFTGGCLCGAVRYESSAKPLMIGNCHCRDCQKSSGAPFVTAMAVPARALKIAGEVKYYAVQADSGNTFSRGFCPACGSRLFARSGGRPELALITAATLDDPGAFPPTMNFYVSSAQPWDHLDPALAKFEKMPR